MRDNKAFASLSSGLLARKGQARPAMRPQGFSPNPVPTDDLGWNDMGHDVPRIAGATLPAGLADGTAPPRAVLPEVLRQQDEIAREFEMAPAPDEAAPIVPAPAEVVPDAPSADAPPLVTDLVAPAAAEAPVADTADAAPAPRVRVRKPSGRTAALAAIRTDQRKAAFTLRLDADRHLLLRLACVVQNRSAQQIVTEALDRLLADMPDLTKLAASLPPHR